MKIFIKTGLINNYMTVWDKIMYILVLIDKFNNFLMTDLLRENKYFFVGFSWFVLFFNLLKFYENL